MEFLTVVIVSGMAVGYITEFVSGLLERWIPSTITKRVMTLPLGTLFNWLLGTSGLALIVATPASGFFALAVLSLINRPMVINSSNRRV